MISELSSEPVREARSRNELCLRDAVGGLLTWAKDEQRMPVALVLILVAVGSVVFHFLSPWWWTPIASNWVTSTTRSSSHSGITGVVFIGIVAFMAYCVFRYRHREGRRAAYEPENKMLEWWLTIGTTVGVAGMLAPGLFVWDQSRPNTRAARGGPAMTCTFHSVITPDGDLWRACWRAMEPSLVAKREKRL